MVIDRRYSVLESESAIEQKAAGRRLRGLGEAKSHQNRKAVGGPILRDIQATTTDVTTIVSIYIQENGKF